MTLHEALEKQGVASTECPKPNKRRLYVISTCRDLGEWSAYEAWQCLENGMLVYREVAS